MMIVLAAAYILLAPFVGGFLAGLDRKISAGFQGRVGPPVLQPFYDVLKLMQKEKATVRGGQDFFVGCFLFFMMVTGALFFAGQSILLVIFTFTTAAIFLVIAAYSSNSPYAQVGANRELLQMMSYEPMVIITGVGFYFIKNTFDVSALVSTDPVLFPYLIGIFIGFVFILTIKLRKSPFDLALSHHAHQEIVRGLSTEFSGQTLAMLEISHWYENVLLLGFIFLFFANGSVLMAVIGIVVCLALYFFEIVIDNAYARMKWQFTLKSSWLVTLIFGGGNLLILYFFITFMQGFLSGGVE
jgi:formate hydrogenlyase subunit 4